MSPLFELKVELLTFNSQKKMLQKPYSTCRPPNQCSRSRDIAPCLIRMSCKINRTRHSLGVSVAKNIKCRIYLNQVAYASSVINYE